MLCSALLAPELLKKMTCLQMFTLYFFGLREKNAVIQDDHEFIEIKRKIRFQKLCVICNKVVEQKKISFIVTFFCYLQSGHNFIKGYCVWFLSMYRKIPLELVPNIEFGCFFALSTKKTKRKHASYSDINHSFYGSDYNG